MSGEHRFRDSPEDVMTTRHQDRRGADPRPSPADPLRPPPHPAPSGGGHRLMMLVCCLPMIVVAVVLLSTGVAGTGAILIAFGCLAMMSLMMFVMPGGHRHR